MKKIHRFLSLLLAAVLLLGMIPAPVRAVRQEPDAAMGNQRIAGINPHYADLFSIEDIPVRTVDWDHSAIRPQAAEYLEMEAAAQVMRDGMANREAVITVNFITPEGNYQMAADELVALAMSHTGNPKEGDSLHWQWGYWDTLDMSRQMVDGLYRYSWTVYVEYYTTAQQEKELDAAVEALLEELDLEGESDYDKIYTVYKYICDNVTYDRANLEDRSYVLKYTPYAALINGTSVCQGYALLFYRLMLELDIDCRFIGGWGNGGGHGWNIVELDGLYYNLDSTWDAGLSPYWWNYFLNSFWDYLDHERDMEYDTLAFHNEYPIAAESYREGVQAQMDPYVFAAYGNEERSIIWYLNRNGTLELKGTGRAADYGTSAEDMPYYGFWADEITGVQVSDGITALGTNSFNGFYAVDTIRFAGDAPSIASNAFTGVTATAYYPADNATWTADKLQNYGGKITWVAEGGEHAHSYTASVTAPTCTEGGFTTYTCSCGEHYIADYVPALGHAWDEGVVTKEPTEETYGEMRYTCTRCSETKTEPIPPVVHSHNYTAVVTAPTCTNSGFTTYTCKCGDSYTADYTDALGHEMGEWYTVTEANCTAGGSERRDCSRCDHYETRVTAKLDHSYTAVVTAPTCTNSGFTTYTCKCGDSYVADYVDALGHAWDDGLVTKEPTEEEYGEKLHTCTRCGETKTEKLPPLEHTHSYEAVVTAPTCTAQGYTTYTCACGDSYAADYIDALGHELGEWTTVTAPTCTESGTEQRVCSRCDYAETREVEATGHSHEAVITAPTCTAQGYTTYTCACGDSYVSDHVDALGHEYKDGVCIRCGEADPDYEKPVENPFNDVPAGAWYEAPILWAVENGITNGLNPTEFGPNATCNRAQVVTFLWRAAGCPEPAATANPFVDVQAGSFYEKPVLWAVENGITNGSDATHFNPNGECNRAQVVTFLYRAFKSPAVSGEEIPFTDVPAGAWYAAPIAWAVENGITNGMGDGTFGVNTVCNRAQVVTFLYRTYVN